MMNASVQSVLEPGTGRFLQISFQQPHFRVKNHLKAYADVSKREIKDVGLGYFLYICSGVA